MSNDSMQLQNMINPPLRHLAQSQSYDTAFQHVRGTYVIMILDLLRKFNMERVKQIPYFTLCAPV